MGKVCADLDIDFKSTVSEQSLEVIVSSFILGVIFHVLFSFSTFFLFIIPFHFVYKPYQNAVVLIFRLISIIFFYFSIA